MELILGTANLAQVYGHKLNKLSESHFEAIGQSEKNSLFFAIDTSPAYGKAEEICNKVIAETTRIYSKVHYEKTTKQFHNSILKKSYSKVLLVHNWEELNPKEKGEALSLLDSYRKQGIVAGIGFSTYQEFCDFETLSKYSNLYIQAPLSVINQDNIYQLAEIKRAFPNTTILARSIFLQGFLATEKRGYLDNHVDMLKLKSACRQLKINPLNFALEFVLRQNFIDGLVLGVNSLRDWKEITDICLGQRLPELDDLKWSELRSLDKNLTDPRKWR